MPRWTNPGNLFAMMNGLKENVLFCNLVPFALCLLATGCRTDPGRDADPQPVSESPSVISDDVVAVVNGVVIRATEVLSLMDSADGGVDANEAVDILVRNELLSQEAMKRGFGNEIEVKYAKKTALARACLKKRVGEDITTQTLDEEKLRALYEANIERFVHGVYRRVRHILVFTGDVGLPDDEAFKVATEIAEEAERIATEQEFVELFRSFNDKYPSTLKLERLKPFDAANTRYVPEFVAGTFAIKGIGDTSPPIKTSFGWHVIFVAAELPAKNEPYEDVRDSLARSVLPAEKELKYEAFVDELEQRIGVFLYPQALTPEGPAI